MVCNAADHRSQGGEAMEKEKIGTTVAPRQAASAKNGVMSVFKSINWKAFGLVCCFGLVYGSMVVGADAHATDLETIKAETSIKDREHDNQDQKHDADIDELKTKHLSKKARIEALEAAVSALQAELAGIQLLPGPQGPAGNEGPPGPSGVCQAVGQICPIGEYVAGFDLSGNIICRAAGSSGGGGAPLPPELYAYTLPPPSIADVFDHINLPLQDDAECIANFGVGCVQFFDALLVNNGFLTLKKLEISGLSSLGDGIVFYQNACTESVSYYAYITDYVTVNGPSAELLAIANLMGGDPISVLGLFNQLGMFEISWLTQQPDGSFTATVYVAPDITDISATALSAGVNSGCSNTLQIIP